MKQEENNCVMKKWVQELTWKEQSAILTAIRGSDERYIPELRSLVRWLRKQTLYNADVDGTFLMIIGMASVKDLKPVLEYVTIHFASHLFHAFEIVGYKHPEEVERIRAIEYYKLFCEMLHCNPETKEQMEKRLTDNREEIE